MSPLRPQPKGLGAIAAIAIMLVGRTVRQRGGGPW